MKKVLVAAFALVSMINAVSAQKGSVLAFGNVGISSIKTGDAEAATSWNVSPGIGYQFTDNWTAGLNIGIGGTKNQSYKKTSQFAVGPFARYTKGLGDIFSIFGQANLNYLTNKYTPVVGNAYKVNGFGIDIFPAVGVNVKNGFALNFDFGGIGYGTAKADVDGAKSTNAFKLNFGKTVNIGISKNFNCGKKK